MNNFPNNPNDGDTVVDIHGVMWTYDEQTNSWIEGSVVEDSVIVTSTNNGIITPSIVDDLTALQELIYNPTTGNLKIEPNTSAYWYLMTSKNNKFIYTIDKSTNALRIDTDIDHIIRALQSFQCAGKKGDTGPAGPAGNDGLPGPSEQTFIPEVSGTKLIINAYTPTPLGTPISIRIYDAENRLLVDVSLNVDGSFTITDHLIVTDKSKSFASYDVSSEHTIGELYAPWPDGVTYKSRQVGPKGADGIDGISTLSLNYVYINNPNTLATEAIMSLRKNSQNDLFYVVGEPNGESIVTGLRSATGLERFSTIPVIISPLSGSNPDLWAAVEPTAEEGKQIMRWGFGGCDQCVEDIENSNSSIMKLNLPSWTPDGACRSDGIYDYSNLDWWTSIAGACDTLPGSVPFDLMGPAPQDLDSNCVDNFFYVQPTMYPPPDPDSPTPPEECTEVEFGHPTQQFTGGDTIELEVCDINGNPSGTEAVVCYLAPDRRFVCTTFETTDIISWKRFCDPSDTADGVLLGFVKDEIEFGHPIQQFTGGDTIELEICDVHGNPIGPDTVMCFLAPDRRNVGVVFETTDIISWKRFCTQAMDGVEFVDGVLVGMINVSGTATGQIIYWSTTTNDWVLLDIGDAGEILTVNNGVPEWMPPHRKDYLVNGNFMVWQRGFRIYSGSNTFTNDERKFGPDQWRIESNGNNIVSLAHVRESEVGGASASCTMTIETANKKFGLSQAIESRRLGGVEGNYLTFSFYAKKNGASVSHLRAAILGFASTCVTPDLTDSYAIVSAWNGVGTNPTLGTYWSYLNTPIDLADLTTDYQRFSVTTDAAVTTDHQNIAVFLWHDDETTTTTQTISVKMAQLEAYQAATQFAWSDIESDISLCQRYFQKTFQMHHAPTQAIASEPFHNGTYVGAMMTKSFGGLNGWLMSWDLAVVMFKNPTITTYNVISASDSARNITTGANSTAPSSTSASDSRIVFIGGTAGDNLNDVIVMHATAEARL